MNESDRHCGHHYLLLSSWIELQKKKKKHTADQLAFEMMETDPDQDINLDPKSLHTARQFILYVAANFCQKYRIVLDQLNRWFHVMHFSSTSRK